MQYPRVLVISPVKFNQQTGSGVTMSNLFRGWPYDSIAQIHTENWTIADNTVCQQYFHLPYEKVRQSSMFSTVVNMYFQMTRYFLGQQQTLFGHLAHLDNLLDWSRKFAPDVIYARPLDRPSLSIWLPLSLSKKLNIPYMIRILDDWPSRHEHDPVLLRRFYWRLFLKKNLVTLIQKAAINIAISDEMSTAFQDRYKGSFTTFHNCVDFSSWQPEKQNYLAGDPFQIVYLGTVHRDKELISLLDLKDAILKLNSKGSNIQFTIYGPNTFAETISKYLEVSPVIRYGGFFPAEEKFTILKNADLLILPLNFDRRSTTYLGYSFQTKVPEYMASGTPVLVYGPADNPNVSYAQKYKWAAVVDKRETKLLRSTIKRLIADLEWRKDLGTRAREIAIMNHDAKIIRPRFQQLIKAVAGGSPILH